MDPNFNAKLRNLMPLRLFEVTAARLISGCLISLLAGGGLVLTGCQNKTTTDTAETPTTAADTGEQSSAPGTTPDSAPQPDPAAPTAPPSPDSDTVTPAPETTTAVQPGPALPDTLTRQWEPASNVLFTFGPMTVTPSQVQWGSGQSSAYTVVSTEAGYLLRLESSPTFYETPNPYIKLMPETDESGGTTSIDVAFYESKAQAESNEYIMYGSYFVE